MVSLTQRRNVFSNDSTLLSSLPPSPSTQSRLRITSSSAIESVAHAQLCPHVYQCHAAAKVSVQCHELLSWLWLGSSGVWQASRPGHHYTHDSTAKSESLSVTQDVL